MVIAEWAADGPQQVLARLGARRHPRTGRYIAPHDATIRRAVDDKTLRGAVTADGHQVHLLSAMTHDDGVVIAQCDVDAEITQFHDDVCLAGAVVTADALHAQRG